MGWVDTVKDGFSSAVDTVGDWAGEAGEAIESGADTLWEGAKDVGQGVVDIHTGAIDAFEGAHDWAANQLGYPDWQSAALQGGMGYLQGGPVGAGISLGMGSQLNPMMQDGRGGQSAAFGSMGGQPLMQGSAGNFDFGMQSGAGGQPQGGGSADLFTPSGAQYGQGTQASTQLLQPNPGAYQFRPLLDGRSDVAADLA